ncbi:MAG: hypothetical protein ABSG37_12175 [Candidatus Limnocylindrales bacterium]|jgi:hypothetical protein
MTKRRRANDEGADQRDWAILRIAMLDAAIARGALVWRHSPGQAIKCTRCGAFYIARRRDSRYCSGRCRVAAHRARIRRERASGHFALSALAEGTSPTTTKVSASDA